MWAMEMHPEDRPRHVEEFRQVLFGFKPRPVANPEDNKSNNLSQAIYAYRFGILLALLLFVLAIILTVL